MTTSPEDAHRWYVRVRKNSPDWREKNKKAAKSWREKKREDPEWVLKERNRNKSKRER